jgi:fumarate reductase flavoprotein subunit
MADGGFQANRELMARYVTSEYLVDGSPLDTGDCLQMAVAIGAKTANMDVFYGHCRHRDALTNPRLSPHPAPAAAVEAGMVVDAGGHRIADEAGGTCLMAVEIAHSGSPGGCWLVFDDEVWNGPAAVGARRNVAELPLNPVLREEGATLAEAASIAELAKQAGLPPEALVSTVDEYNRALADHAGGSLKPPRTGLATPVRKAPFYAIPLIAGVYFAMGGVLVNGRTEVLDEQERPIPGLFAAGGTMAGLMGGPRAGYAGGWSEASTFGLLAGESAMAAAAAG